MYGLVLEGGGSKGSYQIGACRALAEMGIEYSAVAGTSVGALNGAMVVQGDIDRAYELWHKMNPYNVFKMTDEELEGFTASVSRVDALNVFMKRLRKVIAERGLDTTPLFKLLESVIDEERLRKSPMGFGIVTVDLTSRKALEIYKEDIPPGRLVEYIMASASYPAFRRAVIDGKVFIDGSFYNALPINLVKNKGCSDIIVIRTNSLGIKKRFDATGLNITTIEPSEGLGPLLDFNSGRMRQNLKLGYFDTLKVFQKLRGKKYYIKSGNDDSYFINYLARLDGNRFKRLCGLFGVESRSRRVLFEVLIPKIADLLNLPANSTYEEVLTGLLEKMAEAKGIERFRIYSSFGLYSEIAAGFCPGTGDSLIESISDIIFTPDDK